MEGSSVKSLAIKLATILLIGVCPNIVQGQQPAFEGAEGFGATSRGGAGGRELRVSSLDDEPINPQPGMLRWAVQQPGPRIVRFAVAGNIRLKAPLRVSEPFLTLDGSDAPAGGYASATTVLSAGGR